jgi:hypothetical protein
VVHRYSGEVLLRPKTCRVAVADTAAENLRRIAWHSRGVAMELSVPWLVQEEHVLRVQLSSPAAHLESLAPVPSENSAGALARAMLLVQNQSIAAPLVGGAYHFATAATRASAPPAGAALPHLHAHTASAASSSKKSVTPPPQEARHRSAPHSMRSEPYSTALHASALYHASCARKYWPAVTRALMMSLPGIKALFKALLRR